MEVLLLEEELTGNVQNLSPTDTQTNTFFINKQNKIKQEIHFKFI